MKLSAAALRKSMYTNIPSIVVFVILFKLLVKYTILSLFRNSRCMQLIEQFLRLGLLMFVTVDILVTNKKKTRTKHDTNSIDACFGWQERNLDNKGYVINMILLKIIRRGFPVKQYAVFNLAFVRL